MKSFFILIFILILISSMVSAAMCGETVDVVSPCTMVTPSIVCGAYTYQVVDPAGVLIDSGALTATSTASLYSFAFNLGIGDYVILLCDGTTREVHVVELDTSIFYTYLIMFALFLALIVIAWITGVWGFEVLAGMLAVIIGLVLWLVGYPGFSAFLLNAMAIIMTGVGLFFVLYPVLNNLEEGGEE